MKKQLQVKSSKFKVDTKILLCPLVLTLLIFNFSLATSFAYEFHSRATVVMESSTGRILYAKNPNLRLPPASTTKLMTAILVMERADLSEITRISRNVTRVSPLKAGFKAGDEVTIETLLYAALLESANDAAVALAEAVAVSEEEFVNLMNEKADALGLSDTRFINPHGLPGAGQYTTVFDLARIMKYSLKCPKLKEIIGTRVAGISTEGGDELFLKNTNKLLWSEEDLIGGKTGYTRKARHCFVCAAEREKETVVVALLGSPSGESLWRETEGLIGKGFQIMANKEEAVIFFTRADYDFLNVKNASYEKSEKLKAKSKKSKRKKTFTKKKGKPKTLAEGKNKKAKNFRVAEKKENGNKG